MNNETEHWDNLNTAEGHCATRCTRDYTVIYSQPSIKHLENLVDEITRTFCVTEKIEDMFRYGVFCKPQNYVNFWETHTVDGMVAPDILVTSCSYPEKMDFVNKTIRQVTMGEIKKPKWMVEVEMTATCDAYGQPPSTFLNLIALDEKYEKLGRRLLQFLYSLNILTTMLEA